MAIFSGVFTQGGQTQLHKLHMIRQVIGSTLKGGVVLFLITFGLFVWAKYAWQDFWFLLCCFKAWIRVDCLDVLPQGFLDESWIVDGKGVVHTVTDFHLRHSEFYQALMKSIGFGLLKRLVYSLLISLVGVSFLSWFWIRMGRKNQEKKVLSGFELTDVKTLKRIIKKSGAGPYSLGGIPLPKDVEYQHMMIAGTTGTGKSNTIHGLLTKIRNQGDKAVIVDSTASIFSRFYDSQKDSLLNPFDDRSDSWSLWAECDSPNDFEELAETLITANTYEKFWTDAARQLFSESCAVFSKHPHPSLKELLKVLLEDSPKKAYEVLKGTKVANFADPALEKTALSIRITLMAALRSLSLLTEEGDFSLKKWYDLPQKQFLFLSCSPDQREYLKPLLTSWFGLSIKALMARGEARDEQSKQRVWFIIDELASLQKIPSLITALTEIRKYGGCIVLGFQNFYLLEDIYGSSISKAISDLTGTKVIFRSMDSDSARKMSACLGEQEVTEPSESLSFGAHQMREGVNLSLQTQVKPLVRASDLMYLDNLQAYIRLPGKFPVCCHTFSYKDLPQKNRIKKVQIKEAEDKDAPPMPTQAPVQEKEPQDKGSTRPAETTNPQALTLKNFVPSPSVESVEKGQEGEGPVLVQCELPLNPPDAEPSLEGIVKVTSPSL